MNLRFGNERRKQYLQKGIGRVEGWLTVADKFLIWSLCEIQTELGYSGSLGEIGVHHGKLFILLYLNLHEGERAFCIDVFENQVLNVDGSGKGDQSLFVANVQTFVGENVIHVIKDSSLNVRDSDIVPHVGRARLISIDGGHTKAITMHDLALCEKCLCDHGIIVVDDYFNPAWPGVSEGVLSYFERVGTNLVPFAIGPNKIFLCRPDLSSLYRDRLNVRCHEIHGRSTQFLSHDVEVFNGYTSLSETLGYTRFQAAARLARRCEMIHADLLTWMSARLRDE